MNKLKYKLISKQKMNQLNIASLETYEANLYRYKIFFRLENFSFFRNQRRIKTTIQ